MSLKSPCEVHALQRLLGDELEVNFGLPLGSLAAGEVQESVKFSSREKLAASEVFEGRVELLPCRGQRAAPLEGGGQLGIKHGQAWS